MKRSRTKAEKVYVIIYSWLPITRTRANSNQSRFPLDFFLKFTVILPSFTVEPSITRTSGQLEVIFVSLQNISTQFYPRQLEPCEWQVGKKTVYWSPKHWRQSIQFFLFNFLSLQFKFIVHPCILCCLIAFRLPIHLFISLRTSGYLLQTPDNSNFLDFPWTF